MEVNFDIAEKKISSQRSVFTFSPLRPGFGHTLGVSLRRVLLSEIPGAAITSVKFSGARHQFATLPGVREDLVEVVLNLKKVYLSFTGDKPVKVKIEKSGPGVVTAGDIHCPAGVAVVNKDLVIAHLANRKSKLAAEMTVEKGVGYSPAEERQNLRETLGIIPMDAIFTPVLKVTYQVEDTRVGKATNYDKLTLDVLTDGTVSPKEAVKKAAKILREVLSPLETLNNNHRPKKTAAKKAPAVVNLSVAELGLPTRTVNALAKAGYKMVKDLLLVSPREVMEVKNLGKKSVDLLVKTLNKRGVEWS